MKIIKTILISLLLTSLVHAEEDELDVGNEDINEKTAYHFGISMAAGYLTETILHQAPELSDAEKIIYATLPILAVGIAKELNDEGGERMDMVANIVGAFSGAYLSNYVNNNYFFKVEHEDTKLEQKTKLSMGYRF
jgi:hypothetical protein